jgi:hypothetical protein
VVDDAAKIEISPEFALDAQDVASKVAAGTKYAVDVVL